MLRGRKVEPMLWISLAVIVVFGSLTLYLRNEMFIKWKPTILYWIFGGILVYGNIAGRNFIRMLLSKAEIEMPGHAWGRSRTCGSASSRPWASSTSSSPTLCSTDTWVNFKLFGLMGLTLSLYNWHRRVHDQTRRH
ncbi:MAG: inner membrane-spanning protein YciB [Sutterella wadsworthensis]